MINIPDKVISPESLKYEQRAAIWFLLKKINHKKATLLKFHPNGPGDTDVTIEIGDS